MKKSSLILAIIFLISMCSFQRIEAQEKSKEEKDKELQELIEEQKKAMVEQKKVQEEAMRDARKEIEKSNFEVQKAMENLKDLKVDIENPEFQDQIMRVYRNYNGNRSFSTPEPFIYTPGFEFYGRHLGEDTERTSWEFSKSIKETSFDREYIIDVEKSVSNVVMSIVGDCKMGEIRIKIMMPNGKTYSGASSRRRSASSSASRWWWTTARALPATSAWKWRRPQRRTGILSCWGTSERWRSIPACTRNSRTNPVATSFRLPKWLMCLARWSCIPRFPRRT